ncbi:MAG: hypothetical protein H6561_07335 [Lewinellaceae bacterium]|nr:hypothetical protein [Lewinellaceae bacterium]
MHEQCHGPGYDATYFLCRDLTIDLDNSGNASLSVNDLNPMGSTTYTVNAITYNPIDIPSGTQFTLGDDAVSGYLPIDLTLFLW